MPTRITHKKPDGTFEEIRVLHHHWNRARRIKHIQEQMETLTADDAHRLFEELNAQLSKSSTGWFSKGYLRLAYTKDRDHVLEFKRKTWVQMILHWDRDEDTGVALQVLIDKLTVDYEIPQGLKNYFAQRDLSPRAKRQRIEIAMIKTHFATSLKKQEALLKSVNKEVEKNEHESHPVIGSNSRWKKKQPNLKNKLSQEAKKQPNLKNKLSQEAKKQPDDASATTQDSSDQKKSRGGGLSGIFHQSKKQNDNTQDPSLIEELASPHLITSSTHEKVQKTEVPDEKSVTHSHDHATPPPQENTQEAKSQPDASATTQDSSDQKGVLGGLFSRLLAGTKPQDDMQHPPLPEAPKSIQPITSSTHEKAQIQVLKVPDEKRVTTQNDDHATPPPQENTQEAKSQPDASATTQEASDQKGVLGGLFSRLLAGTKPQDDMQHPPLPEAPKSIQPITSSTNEKAQNQGVGVTKPAPETKKKTPAPQMQSKEKTQVTRPMLYESPAFQYSKLEKLSYSQDLFRVLGLDFMDGETILLLNDNTYPRMQFKEGSLYFSDDTIWTDDCVSSHEAFLSPTMYVLNLYLNNCKHVTLPIKANPRGREDAMKVLQEYNDTPGIETIYLVSIGMKNTDKTLLGAAKMEAEQDDPRKKFVNHHLAPALLDVMQGLAEESRVYGGFTEMGIFFDSKSKKIQITPSWMSRKIDATTLCKYQIHELGAWGKHPAILVGEGVGFESDLYSAGMTLMQQYLIDNQGPEASNNFLKKTFWYGELKRKEKTYLQARTDILAAIEHYTDDNAPPEAQELLRIAKNLIHESLPPLDSKGNYQPISTQEAYQKALTTVQEKPSPRVKRTIGLPTEQVSAPATIGQSHRLLIKIQEDSYKGKCEIVLDHSDSMLKRGKILRLHDITEVSNDYTYKIILKDDQLCYQSGVRLQPNFRVKADTNKKNFLYPRVVFLYTDYQKSSSVLQLWHAVLKSDFLKLFQQKEQPGFVALMGIGMESTKKTPLLTLLRQQGDAKKTGAEYQAMQAFVHEKFASKLLEALKSLRKESWVHGDISLDRIFADPKQGTIRIMAPWEAVQITDATLYQTNPDRLKDNPTCYDHPALALGGGVGFEQDLYSTGITLMMAYLMHTQGEEKSKALRQELLENFQTMYKHQRTYSDAKAQILEIISRYTPSDAGAEKIIKISKYLIEQSLPMDAKGKPQPITNQEEYKKILKLQGMQ